ncbi:hypothetical protein LTR86_001314 [Recurvomyces mirabilis]|nr:hypothetical protein LTR86_001314 [Recurvomyces mirabilis]
MPKPFSTIPSTSSFTPTAFTVNIPEQDLQSFRQLVALSQIGPETYENRITDVKDLTSYGIKRSWLANLKDHWATTYEWRKMEEKINSFPNFKVEIEDNGFGFGFEVHFAALFSKKKDAVPLLLLHGWPGSFLEFLGVLDVFRTKYSEDELPYHIIVPSLPGYCFSNGPPLDRDFIIEDVARIMDRLMTGLGFSAYVAQGGDLGSYIARVLGVRHAACKMVHLNLCIGVMPESEAEEQALDSKDQAAVKRARDFTNMGSAYARFHGTRPSTIGLVLSTSPVALLAWIGEKFLQWSDEAPPDDEILDSITLWWFTKSFARAIYPYRQPFGPKPTFFHPEKTWFIEKPLGYSWFPKDLAPVPVPLVAKTGNLVWSRKHEGGGHFAAMEKPTEFATDMEDFVAQVWPTVQEK